MIGWLLGALLAPVAVLVASVRARRDRGWATWRADVAEQLGFPASRVLPGCVVVHAASLGEGRVAAAIVARLPRRVGRMRTFTRAAAAGQDLEVDQIAWAPIDLAPCVAAWLDRVRPAVVVLCEAEIWPQLLQGCRARRIPVLVAGATARRGTLRLLRLWPGLGRDLTWFPVDAAAGARLRAALGPHARIEGPTGDLKASAPIVTNPAFGWPRHAEVVVATSTHEGEEGRLLAAWALVCAARAPTSGGAPPLLVIAPRQASRFDAVARLAQASGLSSARRSAIGAVEGVPAGVAVLVLDTLGEVASVLPRARGAFIGGTLVQRDSGGHAPSEALASGLPALGGPFARGVAWEHPRARVLPAPGPDAVELAEALEDLLADASAGMTDQRAPNDNDPLFGVIAAAHAGGAPRERLLRPWLAPFGVLWSVAARVRAAQPRPRASIPVIAVGALTAGGSGKTEVAAWLASQFDGAVLVARGYGRRSGGDVRTPGAAPSAAELGDELAMCARRGLSVVSAPDRAAGVARAVAEGARVAVLDDGWTTPTLAHDLSVVTIDARWPTGGGIVPVGTRRVPFEHLRRADVVVSVHGPLDGALRRYLRPDALVVEGRYAVLGWRLRGQDLAADALDGRDAIALVGTARPAGFLDAVRGQGVRLRRSFVFPDHHRFSWHELQALESWLQDHVVVTTEKDAARLPADAAVHVLRVGFEVVSGDEALRARLASIVGAGSAPT